MNFSGLKEKLKSKNLLWYAGVALMLMGLCGICYGVWITYNGIILTNNESEEIFTLLDSLGMSPEDGSKAMIGFGSTIIILYLFYIGAGILGILSSSRYITKRNLFWYAIILSAVSALFGSVGILSWVFAGVSIALCLIYAIGVYFKYMQDIKEVEAKRKAKAESADEN